MTAHTRKQKPPGLASADAETAIKRAVSLAKNTHPIEQHQDTGIQDAAAVARMRDQLNAAAQLFGKPSKDWTINEVIEILNILKEMADATMNASEPITDVEEVIHVHPSVSILSDFIDVLEDFQNGVLDPRLKKTREAHGRSLTISDRRQIGFALTFIEILRMDKKNTLLEARKKVAKSLQKMNMRVGKKEMTVKRLQEWGKDYDLNGTKREGN
jgi:hypothetical protein